MEYENIKKLMEDMSNSKLTEISIDFPDGTKISMKKEDVVKVVNNSINPNNTENVTTNEVQDISVESNAQRIVDQDNRKLIKAPMVGTFYLRPSPTADPYVEVGKTIQKGDTVCIIEAMKLMNEIESDISGKVVEVLVNDGDPVEYGMPLFAIE